MKLQCCAVAFGRLLSREQTTMDASGITCKNGFKNPGEGSKAFQVAFGSFLIDSAICQSGNLGMLRANAK